MHRKIGENPRHLSGADEDMITPGEGKIKWKKDLRLLQRRLFIGRRALEQTARFLLIAYSDDNSAIVWTTMTG